MNNFFNKKELNLEGKTVTFASNIEEILHITDCTIVRLEITTDLNRDNICCINSDGTYRWKIEPFSVQAMNSFWYYSKIFIRDGQLHAFLINGFDCHIDLQTGKILDKVFIK